jgi:hypothetical protein
MTYLKRDHYEWWSVDTEGDEEPEAGFVLIKQLQGAPIRLTTADLVSMLQALHPERRDGGDV